MAIIPTNQLNSQNELYLLLETHFNSGVPQHVSVEAFSQQDQSKGYLINHKRGAKGLEAIKTAIKTALSTDSHYVDVLLFSSEKSAQSKPVMSFRVFLSKEVEKPVKPEINTEDYFNNAEIKREQFQGLGGIEELLSVKERLLQSSFNEKQFKYERDIARAKIVELEAENTDLDKENDELNGKNNELLEANNGLAKYVPENQSFYGINISEMGKVVLTNTLKGLAANNPEVAKKALGGITDEQFKQFISSESSKKQPEAATETTKVELETEEELTPEQKLKKQYSDGIAKWLYEMDNTNLKKVDVLLQYLHKDFNKIDDLLELIAE